MELPDGLVAVVKRDCPTCVTVAPVLVELAGRLGASLTVCSQDDPAFPEGLEGVVDDRDLDLSWQLQLDTVPTLLRLSAGREVGRVVGWDRRQWEDFTGCQGLGAGLPDYRPGCGSRTVEPGIAEELEVRFRGGTLRARRVELSPLEDEMEALFSRGWTDGLPVVPPTEARVLAMLAGTDRSPDEVVAVVPPNLVPASVEKVAVNAVLAGCRPEYLPLVLAAVEAACTDEFNVHGVLATTWFAGPTIVVNGPRARAVGMNSGINALGQGNRANATIGRALQLVIRNMGGGRPGGVDRATLGTPGKYTFCFAEDEAGSPWEPLSVERGFPAGASTVTVFAGGGVLGVGDQGSRTPEALARSLAAGLGAVSNPVCLVIPPDHGRVFREAGWSKARLRQELTELRRGARRIEAGIAERHRDAVMPKDGGLLIVYAGGQAGMFSAAIDGWGSGPRGSIPVTREVGS